MALESTFTLVGTGQSTETSQAIFTIVFISIVIGWIIVALWTRALDNFVYGYLGLDQNSTWDALLIAIAATIFFLFLIFTLDEFEYVAGEDAKATGIGPVAGDEFEQSFVSDEGLFASFSDPVAAQPQTRRVVDQPLGVQTSTFFPGISVS